MRAALTRAGGAKYEKANRAEPEEADDARVVTLVVSEVAFDSIDILLVSEPFGRRWKGSVERLSSIVGGDSVLEWILAKLRGEILCAEKNVKSRLFDLGRRECLVVGNHLGGAEEDLHQSVRLILDLWLSTLGVRVPI